MMNQKALYSLKEVSQILFGADDVNSMQRTKRLLTSNSITEVFSGRKVYYKYQSINELINPNGTSEPQKNISGAENTRSTSNTKKKQSRTNRPNVKLADFNKSGIQKFFAQMKEDAPAKLKKKNLAQEMGITPETLSRKISGKVKVSAEEANFILEFYKPHSTDWDLDRFFASDEIGRELPALASAKNSAATSDQNIDQIKERLRDAVAQRHSVDYENVEVIVKINLE